MIPMEFHVDPEKAKLSPIGALCASGIHTLGIMQRLTLITFMPIGTSSREESLESVTFANLFLLMTA